MMKEIVAVGDCNTLGAGGLKGKSYPEKLARKTGAPVHNLGHTMATTREGINILHDYPGGADCLLIQFGLVDSYKTFKYSPYVLYYPDNIIRKQYRSLVKKFKKICRKYGLNRRLGETNTVSPAEYESNIRKMIGLSSAKEVFLLDTIPNKRLELNSEIMRYNSVLANICSDYTHCTKVDLYDIFINNLSNYYLDETHCNEQGYDHIVERILES